MSTSWEVVHRPDDGERVGYLAPAADGAGLVVPMTLAGTAAGGPLPGDEAAALLVAQGLALLARRWWCRLPDPLPAGPTSAAVAEDGWPWRPVVLVEVSAHEVRLRPELPAPEEMRAHAVLPVPAGDALRAGPPDD